MSQESRNLHYKRLSAISINLFYALLLFMFIYDSRRDLKLIYLIAPVSAFVFIEVFIILINWRLPTLVQFKSLILSHLLMFFQISFIIMDVFGYFRPLKLQILLRISLLLIEYIMVNNIFVIVEKGYLIEEYFGLNLLVWNAEHIIYESIFLTIGSVVQFAIYGDYLQSLYFLASISIFLLVITIQFIYGLGLWKVIGNNFSDL